MEKQDKKPWSATDALIKFRHGASLRELGTEYGISYERVRQKLKPHREQNPFTTKYILCEKCHTPLIIEIGSNVKRCDDCRNIAKKHTPTHDLCECGKTKHIKSKRCHDCRCRYPHDIAVLLLQQKFPVKGIAALFGVHPTAIYKLQQRIKNDQTPML